MTKKELDHGYYLAQKETAAYRERNARGSRKRRHQLKLFVLTHYGLNGRLQCCWPDCGVTDLDMLSLDHINNDGAEHRRQVWGDSRGWGGQALYRQVFRNNFPKTFQTLCCNHQMKKELLRKREVSKTHWQQAQESSQS